jgi:uncharacterized protein YuzE
VKAIKIGHWEFDHVEYDADGDVLYLSIGEPRPSYGRETPEGHVQLFDQETDAFCGLTLISIAQLLGRLAGDDVEVTMPARPERVATADLQFALA